jgi:ATP adenylyltransferase
MGILRKRNEKMLSWCDFCIAQLTNSDIGMTPQFMQGLGSQLSSRLLVETEHFSIIAGLGQIVEGYLLVLSKAHYHSISYLPTEFFPELEEISRKVRSILRKEYGEPLIFEHGSILFDSGGSQPQPHGGGMCIDHAHIHYMPVPEDQTLINRLQRVFSWRIIDRLSELKEQAQTHTPYLFVEGSEGIRYVFDAASPPSQYMRKLIAQHINTPERWSWSVYPELERVLATVKRLRKHFSP